MRAVANAALTKGEVTENAVKNYLGEVTNVSAAGKMYVFRYATIDLSGRNRKRRFGVLRYGIFRRKESRRGGK